MNGPLNKWDIGIWFLYFVDAGVNVSDISSFCESLYKLKLALALSCNKLILFISFSLKSFIGCLKIF
jgi:hypothetical protein